MEGYHYIIATCKRVMRIDYQELLSMGAEEAAKYVNFFNTFGYLHIRNAFSRKLCRRARREYKRLYEEYSGKSWKKLMREERQCFMPNFYEESQFFLSEILIEKIWPIAKIIAGGSPIYFGSDGSCFNGQSFEWHRDWFTKARMLKFNVYMNSGMHLGGRHNVIPGSQFTDDSFSQLIGKGGAWPFKAKRYGWLNEYNYFPETPAPRDHYLKRKAREFLGRNYLPYVGIKPSPRDIILFDQRSWHMVERPFPSIPQMLATALFAVMPSEVKGKDVNNGIENRKPSKIEELAALFVGERNMIRAKNYGKEFKNLPEGFLFFRSEHDIRDCDSMDGLSVELSDKSFQRDMTEIMKYYANEGRITRLENQGLNDGYTDIMLGINYSNIAEFFGSHQRNESTDSMRENIF